MASKQVAERAADSTAVQAAAVSFGDTADALARQLGKPEVAKAIRVLLEAFASDLAAKTNAMTSADSTLASVGTDDEPLRAARDDAFANLRTVLIDLRDAVVSGLRVSAKAIALDGATPEQPDDLLRVGQSVEKALRESDPSKLATKPVRGFTFDRDAWLADLVAANKKLSVALTALAVDAKEDQHARSASHRATAAFDAAFSATANLTTTLLTAAGRDDLAARVRPSKRSPGRIATPDEDPAAPTT